MRTFLEELKKRRVYRVAIAYAIGGSAVVQLAGTVFPIFHAPEWAQQLFVVLVALGFPIGLVLAWGFDIDDGAITRTPGPSGPLAAANSRRAWVVGLAGMLIAVFALAAYWFWHPWKTINATAVPAVAECRQVEHAHAEKCEPEPRRESDEHGARSTHRFPAVADGAAEACFGCTSGPGNATATTTPAATPTASGC